MTARAEAERREGQIGGVWEEAIGRVADTRFNFHLVVLDDEYSSEQVLEALKKRNEAGMRAYKRKIFGESEAKGSPVVMVDGSQQQGKMLVQMALELINEGRGRPNVDRGVTRRIDKINELNRYEGGEIAELMGIIKKIIETKRYETPVVIVDDTNTSRAIEMRERSIKEAKERGDMAHAERLEGMRDSVHNPATNRQRGNLGEVLKVLRAQTGVRVVIVSGDEGSYAVEDGNGGMQEGHDYTRISFRPREEATVAVPEEVQALEE